MSKKKYSSTLWIVLTGWLGTAACTSAFAQSSEPVAPRSYRDCPPSRSVAKDPYVALSGGNGKAGFEEPIHWAFEVRVGQNLACTDLIKGSRFRIDLVYFNEGHPESLGHRDGFGAQAIMQWPLTSRISAELGVGPLGTFNSDQINGVKVDEKRFGVLATAALVLYLNDRGLHLRTEINHSQMIGAHAADAILIGLGQDFGGRPAGGGSDSMFADSARLWVGIMAGDAITNNGGAHASFNYGVEIKKEFVDTWAVSAFYLDQGDDHARTQRRGIGAQVWQVIPLTENLTFTGGIGPMLGRNTRGKHSSELDGLITLRGEVTLDEGKSIKLFADFNRLFSASDQGPDADLFRLGFSKRF